MPFLSKDLSVLSYTNGFTLWHYKTVDLQTEVDADGYFNLASDMVRFGDVVMTNTDTEGTPSFGIYLVNANAAGNVGVVNMTASPDAKVGIVGA